MARPGARPALTPEEEALGLLVRRLEDLRIPYMITGSVASSHHRRPRATHDIDAVIDPTPSTLEALVDPRELRLLRRCGKGTRRAPSTTPLQRHRRPDRGQDRSHPSKRPSILGQEARTPWIGLVSGPISVTFATPKTPSCRSSSGRAGAGARKSRWRVAGILGNPAGPTRHRLHRAMCTGNRPSGPVAR